MNIIGIVENKNFGSYQKELEQLYAFYQSTGNLVEAGYLEASIADISRDQYGNVGVSTEHFADPYSTFSTTSVLGNSILVQQVQKNEGQEYYQLFSWDKSGQKYTYLEFDSEDALKSCCDGIRHYVSDPLGVQVDKVLHGLGVSTDHIMNVKINCSSPNEVQELITSESKPSDELQIHLL